MSKSCQINDVQARGGLQRHVNAISNPDRVAGHVASRDCVEHLRRHDAQHHYDSGVHPRLLCKASGGLFAFGENREPARAIGLLKHTRPHRLFGGCCGLGYAENSQSTGQRKTENVRAYSFCEPCGFPFFFTLAATTHYEASRAMLHVFFGGLSLFSASCFPFKLSLIESL